MHAHHLVLDHKRGCRSSLFPSMCSLQDFLQQMSTFRKRGDCMQKRRGESKLDKAGDVIMFFEHQKKP